MTIVKSKTRLKKNEYLISEGISLMSTGAVNMHIPLIVKHTDFLPASFKLTVQDMAIFIDPLIVEEQESADYILITHPHPDHLSLSDIKKLMKIETVIICPRGAYKKLSKFFAKSQLKIIQPGEKIELEKGNIVVEAIGAYNVKSGLITPHPQSALYVGFVIRVMSASIYHAGDTDYIPEMRQLRNINVALVPIDGGNLTMTTEAAAEFINDIKPQVVIPMHYKLGTTEPDSFIRLINSDTTVLILSE